MSLFSCQHAADVSDCTGVTRTIVQEHRASEKAPHTTACSTVGQERTDYSLMQHMKHSNLLHCQTEQINNMFFFFKK